MRRWQHHPSCRVVVVFLLGLLSCTSVRAQTNGDTTVARFRDATAMDIDPKGRVYVADAGDDLISILGPGGTKGTLGGAGTRLGEFDRPLDLDPTNGLTLLVADAGNGRLQRFSEEGQFLEAIPVGPSLRTGAEGRVFEDGRDGADVRGEGRPVAVESTSSSEIFLIDARDDVVVKLDAQRRFEGTVGGGLGTRGTLRNPVDLAIGTNRRLYVADGEEGRILVYDLLGTFVRRLRLPAVSGVQSLAWVRDRLWVVCVDRVVIVNPQSRTTETRTVDLGEELVDARGRNGTIYLLTSTRLLRRNGW